MRNIITGLVAAGVTLAVVAAFGVALDSRTSSPGEKEEELPSGPPDPQTRALEAHEVLYDRIVARREGREVYPEDYGGDYLQEGRLHLCLAGAAPGGETPYRQILAGYEDIVDFEKVDFSLNTLLSSCPAVSAALEHRGIRVTDVAVYEPANALLVRFDPHASDLRGVELEEVPSLSPDESFCRLAGVPFPVPVLLQPAEPRETAPV